MNGKIYKMTPSITKEEVLQNCEYKEIPNYGTVMTYEEFVKCVDSYSLMDYDGTGKLVLYDKVVENTNLWLFHKTVFFSGAFFIPFEILYVIFKDDMKFIWFNK